MLSPRIFPYIAAGLLLIMVITAAALQLPSWATTAGPMLFIFIVIVIYLTWLRKQQFQAATDPALLARAEASVARLGLPPVPIVIVDGGGRPVLHYMKGRLHLSPVTGHLLDDTELDALTLMALTARPELAKRAINRYYLPWLILLAIAGAISLYTWQPWIGLVLPVMVVWTQIDLRRRTIGQHSVETNVQAFLEQGGDARALYAAQVKVMSAVIRTGVNQTALVAQLRGLLKTIAQMGGISQAEVDQLRAQLGAAPELGQKGETKARRQGVGLLVYFVLIILATAIALQLGRPT